MAAHKKLEWQETSLQAFPNNIAVFPFESAGFPESLETLLQPEKSLKGLHFPPLSV